MKRLLIFPLALLLVSCKQADTTDNHIIKNGTMVDEAFVTAAVEQAYNEAFENAAKMQLYLYEDLSTVTFKGEGNEFASYTVKTNWLSEKYVRYEQNNGGSIVAKYYRVLPDGIYLIDQVADETKVKTVDALEELPVLSTLLVSPITLGSSFEGWTITATKAKYTTPYDTFDKVLVLEKKIDTMIERQYYVSGVGAIAYEFETIDDNGEVSIISSKLASMTYGK